MKFFNAVAGNRKYLYTCLDLSERQNNLVLCPLLFSFAYRKSCSDLWSYLDQDDLILDSLMIDSGAPTVCSKGIQVDLDEYGQFIQWVQGNPWVKHVNPVSLDVIPRDRSETEKCAQASLANFLHFKDLGIDSLPVYHYGEHRKWLDMMLDHSTYIGLGGMHQSESRRSRHEWLDGVWDYLEKQNIKGLKVHGFAQTALPVMQRYDWCSVDSTSAVMAAAMGRVSLPGLNFDGTYDYSRSFSLPAGKKMSAGHAARLNGAVKEEISLYLNTIGFQYKDVFNHYRRVAINVRLFMGFIKEVK